MSILYRDNAKPPAPVEALPIRVIPLLDPAPEPWSFRTRDDFPELMNQWGLTTIGVEVGVYRGGFSSYILKRWPGVLHLVDPWEYQPDKRDLLNTPDLPSDYQLTLRCMEDHLTAGRAVIHRQYSVAMAEFWQQAQRDHGRHPGILDWVYIDALHDFDSCLADIRAWAPLVRPGGALCGHDYLDHPPGGQTDFGVVSAVRTWCEENGYDPITDVLTTTHDGYPTWVIRLRDASAPQPAPKASRRAKAGSAASRSDTTP